MKRDIQPMQLNLVIPKRTKEQKIVGKALNNINRAMYVTDRRTMFALLNYACGLLEALMFQDDKEENETTK